MMHGPINVKLITHTHNSEMLASCFRISMW